MKKSEVLRQFKESHVNVIEKSLKNNDIDEIITFWIMHVNDLYLDEFITEEQYSSWVTPNFEPATYIKDLIKKGTAAITEAKRQNQKSVSLMSMARCVMKENVNVPVKWKICTFNQLSNGAKAAFKHFQSEGYDLDIVYTHKTADTKEWFNLIATW